MNRRLLVYVCCCLLIAGFFLAAGWTYWHEESSSDAWVIEHPEQVVSGAVPGEELHVAFILRNTASQPRRILGVEAC